MNGNEPAFPTTLPYLDSGLTKLEYFAGLAMQGLLANSVTKASFDSCWQETAAKSAIKAAKCLITELAKEGN